MVFWSGFIKKIKNAVTKERVDKLEQKINTNATNIELIEQDVDTNTNDISSIRNNITSINSNINDLDNDVTRIENSLTNTNNELDSLEANVNGFDDRINEANTKIDGNTTTINNIPKVQTMIIDFSKFRVDTSYTTDKISYQLYIVSGIQISKDRIISMVPDIDTTNTAGWNKLTLIPHFGFYERTINLVAIRYEWTTSFNIVGKLRIWYI